MKKIILIICFLSVLFLSACNQTKPIDQESIHEYLEELSIQTNVMTATSVFYHNQYKMDRIESIDMNHEQDILLHLIISGDYAILERDVQVLITEDYIYTTEEMEKIAHQMDTSNPDILWQFIDQYFVIIQKDNFTSQSVDNLGQSLINPTIGKQAKAKMLRGQDVDQQGVADDQVKMIEIIFSTSSILEIHIKSEYLFKSTKSESNYASGIHYYFGEPPFQAFPNLSLFSEIE
jgi:hypothetical protein